MDTIITCPLGSKCEEIIDNKLHRCAWFVKLEGTNPQNGERIDQEKCAMAWTPLLMIEGNGATAGINASVQSLRNETVERQNIAIQMVHGMNKELAND